MIECRGATGATDWAVLCSDGEVSRIVVVWGDTVACPSELAEGRYAPLQGWRLGGDEFIRLRKSLPGQAPAARRPQSSSDAVSSSSRPMSGASPVSMPRAISNSTRGRECSLFM